VRECLRPHEAAAVGKDVEHTAADLGVLVVDVRLVLVGGGRGLGIGLGGARAPRALLTSGAVVVVLVAAGPAPTAASAASAAAARTGTWALVVAVVAAVRGGVGGRCASRIAGDRVDQLLAPEQPVTLDAELRRDRVEV
jgi:hypothetical protein